MRRYLIAAFAFTAVALLTTGCGGSGKNQQDQTEKQQEVIVKTQAARLVDIEQKAEFTSNIEAYQENNIAPSLAVRIDQILVDVGARVSKGQLLVRMDPTQYNQANVQLQNLEADHIRMQTVYEAGGISKQQIDQSETQLQVQRDQVADLKTNIELRSPISGVITARNYDAGDLYNGTPILQVMQIDRLKVTLSISETYFPLVKVGMSANINVDMYPDKVFDGKVSLVYPAIDPTTRTFQIEITVPNSGGELRPGMFSRTTLRFGDKPGIMVQDLAVQKQMGSNDKYLYVYENGQAVRREVVTGIQTEGYVEIRSGVSEGEQVIVAGISRVENGTQVVVKND